MTNKTQTINEIFQEARKRFIKWVNDKPTGSFSIEIPVNQGGIRDKPEYKYTEKG